MNLAEIFKVSPITKHLEDLIHTLYFRAAVSEHSNECSFLFMTLEKSRNLFSCDNSKLKELSYNCICQYGCNPRVILADNEVG